MIDIPKNPQIGTTYRNADNSPLGTSTTLNLSYKSLITGHTQVLNNSFIQNKYQLVRTVSTIPIENDMVFDLICATHNVIEIKYTDCGWHVSEYARGQIEFKKKIRVLNTVGINLPNSVLFIYELINVEELKEEL